MKDQAPAFDFYAERWTHGTRHMSKIERCDYIDLLCHQWTSDGLPADLELVARILGYKNASKIPSLVIEKFPISADGKRRNARLEEERSKQRQRIERKRLGAEKTNAKRWGSEVASVSLSDQIAMLERVANESPPPTTYHRPYTNTSCADAQNPEMASPLGGGLGTSSAQNQTPQDPDGENGAPASKQPRKLRAPKPTTADPRHTEFVRKWHEAWKEWQGEDTPYLVSPRDAKALQEFLKRCHKTVQELEAQFVWTWNVFIREGQLASFPFKQSVTIHGFCHHYNDIQAYAKAKQSKTSR